MRSFLFLAACLFSLAAEPLRFRITLDPSIAPQGASGRLFVFLDPGGTPRETIKVGFLPEDVWLAAKEVPFLKPGETIDFNPGDLAYPRPFSQAPKGDYTVMALLDLDHSFARGRQGAGDLVSSVTILTNLDPSNTAPVSLTLKTATPAPQSKKDTPNIKYVELQSPLLTAFWGRPTFVRAGVVLPDDRSGELPAIYHIHGFGGDYREAWTAGKALVEKMASGERMKAVHIFLDGNCPAGHHVFADSVNNGPWGQALTAEFIPHLERRFPLIANPAARFLTGHSSGGWSALWLQVHSPDFFGGTWPTSPDAVDFHSFSGIDIAPESKQNFFRNSAGTPFNLVRLNGRDVMNMEEFTRMEEVTGEYGGQIASFEWTFSPRGADGRPMPLFNRTTGQTDEVVRGYWQRYDIARTIRENWKTLEPKLRGKIRLVVGEIDNFHLNEPAALFCGWMREHGADDACEIVPDRDHFTLYRAYKTYPNGLSQRIDDEMRVTWERVNH
ncbi:MAG: enterochelin esterase [Acidobacteria bacterium]|nr:enterochelin esterase [Acidobacteriota bacterium]